MTRETDVAVIGAGAAGLAAGRALAAAGVRFEVLEAAPRIGGRAATDTATLGVPWDLGCHWLHSAETNPFVAIADRLGFAYDRGSSRTRRWLHDGARRVAPPARDAAWEAVDAGFSAVRAAAAAGRDVAAGAVLPEAGRWAPLVRHWFTMMSAAEPEAISTADFAFYADTDANWPVLDGYGALVAAHAQDLPVTLSCPVTRIDRSGPRLKIETGRGVLEARAAVVAVPTAVVAAGRLAFAPALPADLAEAFAALPLGHVEKVAVLFDRDVFRVAGRQSIDIFDAAGAGASMSVLLAPGGAPAAILHLGGAVAARLLEDSEAALVAAALDGLASAFGADLKRHVRVAKATGWATDPFIGGAYSCALPGKAHLRARLSDAVDDRIFFAGEAVGGAAFSTCHGAHLSGQDAARRALTTLGRAPADSHSPPARKAVP